MISTCDKQFIIPQGTCSVFDGIVWGVPVLGDPTSTGIFSGPNFNLETTYGVPQGFPASVNNSGVVSYSGPQIIGNLQLNITTAVGFASGVVTITHSVAGELLTQAASDGVGTHDYPFIIPASAPGDTITVTVLASAGTGDSDPTTGSLIFSAELGCG